MRCLTVTLLALLTTAPVAAQGHGWIGAAIGYGRMDAVDFGDGPAAANALTGHLSAGGMITSWLGAGIETAGGLSATRKLTSPRRAPTLPNHQRIQRAWSVSVIPVVRRAPPGLPVYATAGFGYARTTAQ